MQCVVPDGGCYLDSFAITCHISSVLKIMTDSLIIPRARAYEVISCGSIQRCIFQLHGSWLFEALGKRCLCIVLIDWSPPGIHLDVSLSFYCFIFANVSVVVLVALDFVVFVDG